MDDRLRLGRECFERRAWSGAYEALSALQEIEPLAPPDLERLATAAYLSGHDAEYARILEQLYRDLADRADERERAAHAAHWLALWMLFRGQRAQSNAWSARGRRLVEDRPCVERGYLLMPDAEQLLRDGRTDEALVAISEALAISRSFNDADLAAAALHLQGRALIAQGRVCDGLRCLDEAMLGVVADELSPIMTGLLYCSVIDCCRRVHAFDRSREWTEAFSRFCSSQPEMVALTGVCYVHRSEVLQFHGAWPDALAEARRACDRARLADREPPGAARYQEAEIHRLRGEFDKAEAGYRAASLLGCEPQPGLALLRLAQGRIAAASASIRRLIGAARDPVERARLLPACIEVSIAAGETGDAQMNRAELKEIAESFDSDVLRAASAQCEGLLALEDGDPQAAVVALRSAFERWERLAAPYEAARVRVLLGRACRALGDHESCELECEAARAVFTRLGARPDIDRLEALATSNSTESDHPLTSRELEVLRLIASGHSNKSIARSLGLSDRTVDRHVSNILGKLQVATRTAATAYAYSHNLI
jgi:DNA-binding NarL/FixJ family response regulator